MKMQLYKYCCWSLKTGVLIFGIFEIIRYLVILACAVIDYNGLTQNYTGYENYTEYIYDSNVLEDPELLYFYVPACFIMLVLTSLMIFGSQKTKYKFIMPHFYAHLFLIISSVINQLYKVVVEFAFYKDVESGSILLAKALISSIFDTYFCLIEFSRIKEIKGSKNTIYPLVL